MEIRFSRHARRRIQLYKISEKDVIDTIKTYVTNSELVSGKVEVINKKLSKKYGYPLKIVFSREGDKIIVITAYPLRRGRM